MLTAYLVCLLVGGVFVGLSVFAGLGKGVDGGKDFGKDVDKDLGKDFDKEFELDEPGHDHDFTHSAPTSDAGLAGHPGERREVPRRRWRYKPAAPWLPFTSMRFWTFGACFFGLTGVALTQLAGVGEPAAALTSLGVGLASGTATAWVVRRLRQPIGAVSSARGWVGVIGELTHALGPGQVSKVRVRQPGRPPRELLAVLAANDTRALPRDTRVVVLDFKEHKAVVEAADPSMLPVVEPIALTHEVSAEEDA